MEIHEMPNSQKPASQAATPAPAAEGKADFKKQLNEALADTLHSEAAKSIAKTVLSKITAGTVSSDFSDINKQIVEAGLADDTDKILELSTKLKNIKDSHKTHDKGYAQLRDANDFSVILKAYKADIEKLAYEIAYTVLTSTQVALEQASKGKKGSKPSDSGDKSTREAKVYTVTKDGKSVTFYGRSGRAGANLTQDKEALEFLGFKIVMVGDKEKLEPATVLVGKNNVESTRGNIVKSIQKEAPQFAGYEIVEKKSA